MRSMNSETSQKLRGGFYTPPLLAKFLSDWAVRAGDRVLEPSCGDGSFLKAVRGLNKQPRYLLGIEIDPIEASKARKLATDENWVVQTSDYLDFQSDDCFDAVIGNPPFVRYQYLSDSTQKKAAAIYHENKLRFTKHTNLWAPFVIKAVASLRPGGRFAMVVPGELLNVLHAGAVRKFLLRECSKILVIDTNELMFEGTLQRTLMVIAIKRTPHDVKPAGIAFKNVSMRGFADTSIQELMDNTVFMPLRDSSSKWMLGLLTEKERAAYLLLLSNPKVKIFENIATVHVGIVTGANAFFVVNSSTSNQYSMEGFLKPIFGRSSQVSGLTYTKEDHKTNWDRGVACGFLDLNDYSWNELPAGIQEYIKQGEKHGLHLRYKTRIRYPWWKVPSVYSTNIALMKRASEAPRLIANESKALTTDTAYRITSTIPPKTLSSLWLNSLTLLACELSGRTYGGGVLELVPSEIRSLPIPITDVAASTADGLDTALRKGSPVRLLLKSQNRLIAAELGVCLEVFNILEEARMRLLSRRTRRTE